MKKNLAVCLVLMLALVSSSMLPAKAFEGFIRYAMPHQAKGTAMDLYVRKSMMRMEPRQAKKGLQGVILLDHKKHTNTILMLKKKQYMIQHFDIADQKKSKDEGKVVKTGKTKKIIGFTASEWLYTNKKKKVSVWGTTQLGEFGAFWGNSQGKDHVNIPAAFGEKNLVPLEVVSKGKVMMRATKVEKKSLSPSLFVIPKGYHEMKMPSMPPNVMEQLKNLPPKQREMMEKMLKGR